MIDMETPMNTINWFEIPVTNFERARDFYNHILDFEMIDSMVGEYRMGFLPYQMKENAVGGAIVLGEGYLPSKNGSKLYLNGGNDLNVILNRIEDAGGKVLLKKTEINKEAGFYAMFEDTEGNVLCLHSRN